MAEQTSTIEEVWDLLDTGDDVDEDIKYLVAAALEGDGALVAQLGADAAVVARPDCADASGASPVTAYLQSITVAGFRGIGPESTLPLIPGPGLTVVSGRNGSGKSSFSEALECAVTGSSYRWSAKGQKFWQSGWRNLHRDIECRVGVGLVQQPAERAEPPVNVSLSVKWTSDDVADCERLAKPVGGERRPAESVLGWRRAVELYRPILSYEELGNLFGEGRAALYDALNQILGLDDITAAAKRIDVQLKELGEPRKRAKAARTEMRRALDDSGLDQAKAVLAAIRLRAVDLDAVRLLVSGGGSPREQLVAQLRRVADEPADIDELAAAARLGELRAAIDQSMRAGNDLLALLAERTELLDSAVRYVRTARSSECPVCDAPLPDDWVRRTETLVGANRSTMAGHDEVAARLRHAESQVRELLGRLRIPDLGSDLDVEAELPEFVTYRAAVERARDVPDTPAALAQHAADSFAEVEVALTELRGPAAALATRLDDEWAPFALMVMGWLQLESEARPRDIVVDRLTAAKRWLKDNSEVLRAQRMAPIQADAVRIWSELRQQSDIDLTSISLAGSSNAPTRHVDLEGTVDGMDSPVLPVMSQGELQALALALFIPRATLPASPFGFVVLDDPIQAMDPAKIDGFLAVLRELAQTRQVIVFSHDDRLPTAIRRLAVDAQLLTVIREPESVVKVERSDVPADRHIKSIEALLYDEAVPPAIKHGAGPGLFRMAVESAARQQFYSRAAQRQLSQASAEELWERCRRTKERVALALGRNPDESLGSWQRQRPERDNVMRICTRDAHEGAELGRNDIRDVRRVVDDILGRR